MRTEQEPGQPDLSRPSPAAQEPAQARAGTAQATVLVVDATGLLVRCSRAGYRSPLNASDGTPTGALHFFIQTLAAKIRAADPAKVILAWDGDDARAWRRAIYPGYKAQREHPGAQGRQEMELAREFTFAAGFAEVTVPGFEADDVMAALWRAWYRVRPGDRLVLCTEDKDLLQLLSIGTLMLPFSSDKMVTGPEVVSEWGVSSPADLPRVRALAGDASDNIPGLKGIGPKKAAHLISTARDSWLLTGIGADDIPQVQAWHSIMDLRNPARRPEDERGWGASVFDYIVSGTWHPRHSAGLGDVHRLLDKYELKAIRKRLEEGRLW